MTSAVPLTLVSRIFRAFGVVGVINPRWEVGQELTGLADPISLNSADRESDQKDGTQSGIDVHGQAPSDTNDY